MQNYAFLHTLPCGDYIFLVLQSNYVSYVCFEHDVVKGLYMEHRYMIYDKIYINTDDFLRFMEKGL